MAREIVSKSLYFSEKLLKKLNNIFDYSLTIVEAPSGYGKTTAIREFFNNLRANVVFVDASNKDEKGVYDCIREKIALIDSQAYAELMKITMPFTEETLNEAVNILKNIRATEETYFIIDNYEGDMTNEAARLISGFVDNVSFNFSVIILIKGVTDILLYDLIFNSKVNHITKNYFSLEEDDIVNYFAKNGAKITQEQAKTVYEYTDGWVSAVYLQLKSYLENKSFEFTGNLDLLIEKTIWSKLNEDEKNLFAALSIFDSFSSRQANLMAENDELKKNLQRILTENEFVRYDYKQRKYYFSSLFNDYLKNVYLDSDDGFKKYIITKAGDYLAEIGNIFEAIKKYYSIDNYEAIFSLKVTAKSLYKYAVKENRRLFIDILINSSYETKGRHIEASIVFTWLLLLYNERDLACTLCEEIKEHIDINRQLPDTVKNIYYGELEFLKSFIVFNDIEKMDEYYKLAYSYMKRPSRIIGDISIITYGCPSVLMLFHKEAGRIREELNALKASMPDYYKLTSGQGKGSEALMQAEMLYNEGDFESAKILCHKAMYMADSRDQQHIYMGVLLVLAKMYAFEGDIDELKVTMATMKQKSEKSLDFDLSITAELCFGTIYAIMEKYDLIPAWLNDNETIEEKCNIMLIPYANMIFGKVLLKKEQFAKLLGISGQFLGIASIHTNLISQIYTYIYIARSNMIFDNREKAARMLSFAVDIAEPDNMYMPFVENYTLIETIMNDTCFERQTRDFLKKVKELYLTYRQGIKRTCKSLDEQKHMGLTAREYEVAALAAERLTNKEIAGKLFIAESTVKSNLKIIYNKLQINSRSELKNFF